VSALAVTLLLCAACQQQPESTALEHILKSGELTILTRNNAHCYYLYRDEAMGFEYDLARAFADHLGVRLRVIVAEDWNRMIPDLLAGRADIIAASLTITPRRMKQVSFSRGYMEIQQFMVVHRKNHSIHLPFDLDGKTVHTRRGTSYAETLEALRARGINVDIRLHDNMPTEELIRLVAEKKIEATIADSNIALLNRRYYPDAVLAGPLTRKQALGWAVAPSSRLLRERINAFFDEIESSGKLKEIYNRYYRAIDTFDYLDVTSFHRRVKKRLPALMPMIQAAAERHGLDWRLIAAQMYQESHFDPRAASRAGAFGLMQLTKKTAGSLGVKNVFDPAENIDAGVRHLKELYDRLAPIPHHDRLMLALAAYNIGWGHISDARRLAEKMSLDPDKWASIQKVLPLLSHRKYYRQTTYGYCRGQEPVRYVEQIAVYYDILKRQALQPAPPGAPE